MLRTSSTTVGDLVRSIKSSKLPSDTPLLDCQLLLSECLQRSKGWLLAHDEYCLTDEEAQTYTSLLARRIAGEPIAYILGSQGFWDMELRVTPDTLIPRPETELLVETVLATCGSAYQRVVDLGTGTGAIAIAIQRERPNWEVWATDFSSAALTVAEKNAVDWSAGKIQFLQSHWLSKFGPEEFDLIISNPPYIQHNDNHLQALQHEPTSALTASDNGMADLKTIIRQSTRCLKPGGRLLLEHGYDQQAQVTELLEKEGYTEIVLLADYNHIPRAVLTRWAPDRCQQAQEGSKMENE